MTLNLNSNELLAKLNPDLIKTISKEGMLSPLLIEYSPEAKDDILAVLDTTKLETTQQIDTFGFIGIKAGTINSALLLAQLKGVRMIHIDKRMNIFSEKDPFSLPFDLLNNVMGGIDKLADKVTTGNIPNPFENISNIGNIENNNIEHPVPLEFRENINSTFQTRELLGAHLAEEAGLTGKGIKVAVLDSIPNYSPVIIKDKKGFLNIIPIEDFWKLMELQKRVIIKTDKEEEVIYLNKDVIEYRTYDSRGKWKVINYIIRHKYNGTLKRIRTPGGITDVTPNHSLIKRNGDTINARVVGEKDDISVAKFDKLKVGFNKKNCKRRFFIGTKELAKFYGLFAADGSAYKSEKSSTYCVSIANTNPKLISFSKRIFKEYFNCKVEESEYNGVKKIYIRSLSVYEIFRSMFYTNKSKKKVPTEILNAPIKIVKEFLDGYISGDGHIRKYELNYTTNSWTLAQGILLLFNFVGKDSYTIHFRKDKLSIIEVFINFNQEKEVMKNNNYRNRFTVTKTFDIDYDGYVYDLSTENERFIAGVGGIRHHNTGVDIHHPQIPANIDSENAMEDIDEDSNGHGTFCATTVYGKPTINKWDIPVKGVAIDAIPIAIKCLGYVIGSGSTASVLKAIELSVLKNVDIISMSLGSDEAQGGLENDPLIRAVETITAKRNIIFVIAAGNSGPEPETIGSPGVAPSALTVGAIDPRTGKTAQFSSRGPKYGIAKPDVVAPGVDCYSGTSFDSLLDGINDRIIDGYCILSGTSMATPHVAGLCAILRQQFPNISTEQIKQVCAAKGHKKNFETGWGLMNWSWFNNKEQ